ncbi:MFS transporter [Methylovirgula sp. 4M-Z18]|uniref:MFS transporter n=1 Tax=Methylovirgula sp. 4M-Z18 TaxID=2293567 RepID=UPI000E2E75D7|nr:MFS transporter [Methylovirgula sp. 4M-Z18]RFB78631.1 MFS transporter [Methylovirgula sp. 4M-Z18]
MTDGLPNPQRLFAFLTIAIALTMAVLDGAIVNVALPSIGQDLAITPAQTIWVVNAYQLAVTISLLPLASIGDSVGYKKCYWTGLAVFTVASFACANAHSLLFLSLARVVQGFGAAGVMSVNIALVRFIFPRAQLGIGVGYTALVVAVSSAAGPSVASAILSVGHWQWLFLVNVPLGLAALVIAARALPVTPASGNRFDVLSALLNAITFGALIAGLNALSDEGHGERGAILIAIAAVFGVIFVQRERRLTIPMLPVDLLRLPVFALSVVTSIGSFAAQSMAYVALPFFFEQDLGRSETATGLLMTPWPLMTALTAPIAGKLSDQIPPERLGSIGLTILAIGLILIATMGAEPSSVDIGWRLAICGLGFGIFQSPNNKILIGSAPRERSGGASGIQSTARLLGQSMGAVTVAVVFGVVRGHQTVIITSIAALLALIAAGASGLRKTAVR